MKNYSNIIPQFPVFVVPFMGLPGKIMYFDDI
jgi:hypothetical protein